MQTLQLVRPKKSANNMHCSIQIVPASSNKQFDEFRRLGYTYNCFGWIPQKVRRKEGRFIPFSDSIQGNLLRPAF